MRRLTKPKNQYAQVIHLLIENYAKGVTMVDAMRDWFHKFQTRLGEIEKRRNGKLKLSRLNVTTKNRFGHTCTYKRYKSNAPKPYLINLFHKLNERGLC